MKTMKKIFLLLLLVQFYTLHATNSDFVKYRKSALEHEVISAIPIQHPSFSQPGADAGEMEAERKSSDAIPVIPSENAGPPPTWITLSNPQYNMAVIGKIQVSQGVFSLDEDDIIGAFVGAQCRGVASPLSSLGGTLFLTIGSNVQSGETVTFKVYRSSTDEIFDVNETVAFQNAGEVGTMADPFISTPTQAASPIIVATPASLDFGNVQIGTSSTPQTYTVSGTNLTADISITAPTGYQVCTTLGGSYSDTLTLTQTADSVSATAIYVKFSPTAVQAYNDNITNTSTGAVTQDIAVTAAGIPVCPGDSAALMALYNATDGASWTNNTNWDSTQPLNTWHGITTNTDGCVTEINLGSNNLAGSIPSEIGNLTSLTNLNLEYNQLSDSIPTEIGNLTNLEYLSLGGNQLTDSIPISIGNLINLKYLYLQENQLNGSIPISIGNLTNLIFLHFNNNQLSGSIPTSIGNLTNLNRLSLGYNHIESIPASIGNLTNLTILYLFNNQLSGSIPAEISNLTNLQTLSLSNNQLTGTIPASIGNLTNLTDLRLGGNLFGLENCSLIQSLVARGGWSIFWHSPQSNGVDFNNCPTTTISTADQIVSIGSNFVLDVNTTELYVSDNIISYQFNLVYDTTKLQYVDKSLTATVSAGGLVMIDEPVPGVLNVSYMRATSLTGTGSILKLDFNPLQIGESDIVITNFLYNTHSITSVNNANIMVVGKYGDVDVNDYVQAYDAALTLQYSVGLNPLPAIDPLPWENWRKVIANVDDIGDISAYDASLILQHSAGIITQFPVEGTKQTSSTAGISITRSLTDNELLFTSTGDLFGLNISVSGITNIQLGTPVILDANMLLAKNITGTTYNLGLSTVHSPADNTVVMKIPFTCTSDGSATFNMMVNNDAVIKTIPLNCSSLSVTETNLNAVALFPNPTSERVYINSSKPVNIKVYNLLGKLILSTDNSKNNYVSLSEKGIYLFELITEDNTVYKKVIVQ